ncbi:AAA-like domain protein [uncultured archaeon]|nr:AAA-like domain protein [uncultured archaeon]
MLKQLEVHDDARIYILDPNAEYNKIVSKMKGKVIELSQESDSMINVFDLQGMDFSSKMMQLIAVYDIITGGLTESQKGVLGDVLLTAYTDKGIIRENPKTWDKTPPTFKTVYDVLGDCLRKLDKRDKFRSSLEAKSYEVLINRTKLYIHGGLFEFLDTQTKLDMKTKVVSFDLSKLPQPVKPLLMFIVLDFIVKQIKKDKENKVLLVDEGWSLLKSKEAENYVLEFVKNSRRFGCSVGFVTQDLEDLLASEGGKGILNMTQTKILMRQNTSNIDLLTKYLKLNDYEKDGLISANKGYGLLITGDKHYKFFIQTSDKMHELITTNPNDEKKTTTKKKRGKKEKIDLSFSSIFDAKNYYALEKDLTPNEKKRKLSEGWKELLYDIWDEQKTQAYLVMNKAFESPEHALLCYAVADECKQYSDTIILSGTVNADVVVITKDNREIAFEIETGSNLNSKKAEFEEKMKKNNEKYKEVYIVLTNSSDEDKYKQYARVIKRKDLKEQLKQILKV